MKKHQTNKIYSQSDVEVTQPLLLSIIFTVFSLLHTDSKDKPKVDSRHIALLIINKNNNLRLDFIDSLKIKLKDHLLRIIITIVYTLTVELTTDHPYSKIDREYLTSDETISG